MKKQLIIATLALGAIVFGTANLQAQTATTEVNLKLSDVISIEGNSVANGGVVDFNYVTAEDYNTDTAVTQTTALIVTSTKIFNIMVKADGANFINGSNEIPVNVMNIKGAGSSSSAMGGTMNEITLSTDDQILVKNAPLGSKVALDLTYKIPATQSSSPNILGKPAGTYTQNVTYTATAL